MDTKVLNYRIIIEPDRQTGTGKLGYSAYCPSLGVADDGETVEKAISNIKQAISVYIKSLIEDKEPVPVDEPERDIVTTAAVNISGNFQMI